MNNKCGTLAEFTLGVDLSTMEVNHASDIRQSEPEALNVVTIAGRDAVKAIEDLL